MIIDVELIKEHLIHKLGGYTQSDMDAEKARRKKACQTIGKYVNSTLKWQNEYWELKNRIVPIKVGIVSFTGKTSVNLNELHKALMERIEQYVTYSGDDQHMVAEISICKAVPK